MYRLLIVDDEPDITDGLYELFSNERSFDFDVYKAYSGIGAIEYLEKMKIDVVLTDICMPGMTGMQLLHEITWRWPECRVIFLTGYREFDYVYTAINSPGVKYILKTDGDEVVCKAVRDAIAEIDREIEQTDVMNRVRKQMELAVPVLRNEFFMQLLDGQDSYKEIGKVDFDELDISLHMDMPVLMILAKPDYRPSVVYVEEMIRVLYSIQDIFKRFLDNYTLSLDFVYKKSILVFLLQPKADDCRFRTTEGDIDWKKVSVFVKGNLESIQNTCRDVLKNPVSFIMSRRQVDWGELHKEFETMKVLLDRNYTMGKEMLFVYDGTEDSNAGALDSTVCKTEHHNIVYKLKLLETYLESGEEDRFREVLYSFREDIKDKSPGGYFVFMEILCKISGILFSYINSMELLQKTNIRADLEKLLRLDEYKTLDAVLDKFSMLGEEIFKLRKEEKSENEILKTLHLYVNKNLGGDLSLVKLADVIHFNPSYLSRFYKQETGKNLSDYINEVKLSKAMELLADKQLKVNEIVPMLGFETPSYFATFFKKLTNITPQKYRDSL